VSASTDGAAGWARDAVFYHVYPLGLCGAPASNDFDARPEPRLRVLLGWLDHLVGLGVTALYLGPLFESTAHGYDTADFYHVDRRLGTDDDLRELVRACHDVGIRVILDGVFNHVGRNFWAFRDVRERGVASPYASWFRGLRFDGRSSFGDPFAYGGWAGNFDLVKLEVEEPAVREHLFGAVASWFDDFGIDGLRLDAADVLDHDFLAELAAFVRARRPDAWLVGEVVHGDYNRWAHPGALDSVTNYECYKGLWSSLVDRNYFEIAYALNRQSGDGGLYRDLALYTFADNHDVNRVATSLQKADHLAPLYCLLFTMPGIPSIYYGSEWGIEGRRTPTDDRPLRPALDLATARSMGRCPELAEVIGRLARIRHATPALRHGDYRQLAVSHEQLAFSRELPDGSREGTVIVVLNAADHAAPFDVAATAGARFADALNGGETFLAADGRLRGEVGLCWARILVAQVS
jgi:cyclomaltodextrinase / maltogenic alpha-amylase / neopullulanase